MKQTLNFSLMDKLREECPLVHNMTNYVTVNDCANALLAIGGSPIMSDDEAECADITGISRALVMNIGTLNQRTIASMIKSGKKANETGIPVVFDPVGAGASSLRNETTKDILSQVKIAIIRGNLSELSYIAGLSVSTKGVDVAEEDMNHDAVAVAKKVAKMYETVVAITGKDDVVTDGDSVFVLSNGVSLLSKVTGTGCMTSAMLGAFAAVACENKDYDYVDAAALAISSMSIAGEISFEKYGQTGTGSFHIGIIDALSNMTANILQEKCKINIVRE